MCPTRDHGPALLQTLLDDLPGIVLSRPIDLDLLFGGEDRKVSVDTLSAIPRAATPIRIRDISQAHRAYAAIARWVEATGHEFAGPIREVLIQLPATGGPDTALLELQIPVTLV